MGIRITYGPWGETLAEMLAAGQAAEAAGAEVLWVPELHRSATIQAAVLAAGTSTAQIGTAIALAFTRSPMVTALEALDLDEMSEGRFILGLGTGVQRLNELWHNARWGKPVAHLRETVRNVRNFVAYSHTGAKIKLDGEFEPMHITGYERPFTPVRMEIPIYLAAMGPGMTRLAGEIGDGWISHELCSPQYLAEQLVPLIREGMAISESPTRHFDVVASGLCSIDPDGAKARRHAAGTVGFYASVKSYETFFDWHGFSAAQSSVIEAFRGGTGADYLGEYVPDSMVEGLTFSGTPDEVRAKVMAYEGIATTLKLTPPTHGLRAEDTRNCQSEILRLIADVNS